MRMDTQISEHLLQVTKSSTSHIIEDGDTVVALCTEGGQLLELIHNKVVDSCDIDNVAEQITVFTSYDPLQKYYLLQCQKQLIVVKRSKPLCVIESYNNVEDVKIEDRLRIGRPQVVVKQTDKEPVITDFVGQLKATVPHAIPSLTASLSGKLQELNARVAKIQRLFQERQSLRYKATYRFTPHLQPPLSESQKEQHVLVWGPPSPPVTRPPAQLPLILSSPWRKIHNTKWIVGIPVFNTTDDAVCDLRIRLRQVGAEGVESCLRYRSLVMGFGQRETTGGQWTEPRQGGVRLQRLVEVAGRTTAVLIVVLDEPLFKKSVVVSVTGSILYKRNSQSKSDVQDVLNSEIILKVEDLIHGNLVPFSQPKGYSEIDLISVVVSSLSWQLLASPRHRMCPPLSTALGTAGLVEVKELGCWIGPSGGGAFTGLLVIETDGDHSLHVYAREMKQVVLLVHSLRSQWKVRVKNEKGASVEDCMSAMRSELCVLRSITRPGAEHSADQWTHIREQLNPLELATDLTFASHLPL